MSDAAESRYRSRFRKVLDHIDAHLADELSVDDLSSVAAFSKFHFQRQFSSLFGIGVYKYVQLRRLKRASYRLAFRDDQQIVEIALDSGYDGPEAFARAFKKTLGQTPSEFRDDPQWSVWHDTYGPMKALRTDYMKTQSTLDDVRIVSFPETRVAVYEHRGHVAAIGSSVRKFIEWRRSARVVARDAATFNVVYKHSEEDCRYDICAATERDVPPNGSGVVAKSIPGGRCAVLRHIGSDDTLSATIDVLYAKWLPQSGEELRDFPIYFQRVRMFPDVPEAEAITDVFLPLV